MNIGNQSNKKNLFGHLVDINHRMKRLIPSIICCCLLLLDACKKDEPVRCQNTENYRSTGIIYRSDVTLACACCSRYFIQIDTQMYNVMLVPASSYIDIENDPVPMTVSLNWHVDTANCANVAVIDAICRK